MSKPVSTIHIEATATRELENDILSIAFSVTEVGAEAKNVQDALQLKLAEALEVIRPLLNGAEVEVETSGFSVHPTYVQKKAKPTITGYSGNTGLLVKGTDTATISSLAGKITSMSVKGTSNSLSIAKRKTVEEALVAEAIAAFCKKAQAASKAFNQTFWDIGEIRVYSSADGSHRGGNVSMAMAFGGAMESSPSISVEGGKTTVRSDVSGTIVVRCG